jgi:hypothetical protein
MTQRDWKSIPTPPRMAKLEKDHRGYPIPANVLRNAEGKAFFTINDDRWTWMQGFREQRCPLCGDTLDGEYWFVGGPLSCFDPNGAFRDLPGHYDCMVYALQVCPYLVLSSYGKRTDDKQLRQDRLARQAGLAAYVDPTVLDTRPPFFGLCRTRDYTIRPQPPTAAVIPERPWLEAEVWKDGERIDDEAEIQRLMDEYRERLKDIEAREVKERFLQRVAENPKLKEALRLLNERLEPVRTAHESFKVDLPAGKSGEWEVDHFTVEEDERQLRYAEQGRAVPLGRYTRLTHHGSNELFMTDTPAELNDARDFLQKAHGHVLITGLGIGMIPKALFNPLLADWRKGVPPVVSVTIIEKDIDVIRLVAPSLAHLPVDILCADAFTWEPNVAEPLLDIAWHDIWPTICPKNLEEFELMREHYAPFMRPGAKQFFWVEEECHMMAKFREQRVAQA